MPCPEDKFNVDVETGLYPGGAKYLKPWAPPTVAAFQIVETP
jgi:hypothetical protein